MIRSFADSDTADFFTERKHKRFANFTTVGLRKLDQLEVAELLTDLKLPPGNHLEALKGDRAGQHSIRINNQYRVCFIWTDEGPAQVEITDYH